MKNHNQPADTQQFFFVWLKTNMPFLLHLFDVEQSAYIPKAVENYLSVASSGEQCMCRFALMIWRHDNHFEFDLSDVGCLSEKERSTIADWLRNPFWP